MVSLQILSSAASSLSRAYSLAKGTEKLLSLSSSIFKLPQLISSQAVGSMEVKSLADSKVER